MSKAFTVAEIFDVAIHIERRGAVFYEKAAKQVTKPALRRTLLTMAKAEEGHMQRFADLRKTFVDVEGAGKRFEPDDAINHYLQSFAMKGVFNLKQDAAHALAEQPGMRDILQFAIERERDSIMFYTGIREAIPKKTDRKWVEVIIYEEMAHLGFLDRALKRL